jgi:diaminohydroxyphosphoribosylaminopyrimidine deaminase/5-amino-6-(5-phosphoribosylamino)uracil reductase
LNDDAFMGIALALARRGHGNAAPNPSVGCVIVRDGVIVGRGWTQPGGRPHAETEALRRAGNRARSSTAYVTLEPCAHHGRTPPCAEALISAGVARVVVAISDPDPRVDGGGIEMLRAAGIEVTTGLRADEAEEATAGFLFRIREGRPLVTVKAATTLDGRIATSTGESQWITGEISRALGHGLRARHDAILVGGQTALADDPSLTCRLPGLAGASPIRVVLDGRQQLPLSHALVATARETPTWILTRAGAETARLQAYRVAGAEVIEVSAGPGSYPDLRLALASLAERGVTRLLVEGGGRVVAALLEADLVDRIVWFRAPVLIGGDGIPVAAACGVRDLDAAPKFVKVSARPAGPDTVEIYARAPAAGAH